MTTAQLLMMPTPEINALCVGHRITIDGVSGILKVDHNGRLCHHADARGRRSQEYQRIRGILRDDYVTEITDPERLVETWRRCGIVEDA